MNRLQGKASIVTGSGSGLGKASAIMFAAEGASVVCVDINGDAAALVAQEISDRGGTAIAIQADLTDEAAAENMTMSALDRLGELDIVYACAGIAGGGTADNTSMAQWQRVISVNLTSKWLSFKYALPHMVERGKGSVIVQSSIGGFVGVPGIFPYAAAKGGCIAMVKQAAVEYGPKGVRINGIAPGNIPTPLVYESYAQGGGMAATDVEEGLRRAAELFPMRRLGTPEENAFLATYIASDESSWTTGHIFVLDGGFSVP